MESFHQDDRERRSLLLWVWLFGALLASLAILAWDTLTLGHSEEESALLVVAATSVLGWGTACYLLIGASRGLLTVLWPGLLFPVLFCGFHFGSFGTSSIGWYDDDLFPAAWTLSVACLLSWMIGYLLTRGRQLVLLRPRCVVDRQPATPGDMVRISNIGTIVFCLGFILVLYAIGSIGFREVLFSAYMRSRDLLAPWSGNPVVYINSIGQLLCVVGVVITACAGALGQGNATPNIVFRYAVTTYLLGLLVMGDRSELSIVLLPILMFHHYFVRRISFRRGTLLALVVLLIFGLTKAYRGSKDLSEMSETAPQVVTVEKMSDEIGYTLDTVIRSMSVVPHDFDYFGGATYGHAVARALPNLRFTQRQWGFVSSVWINRETAPELARRRNALGFSIVAEAYINFGLAGAPLVLFVFGLAHGRAERSLAGPVVRPWLVMAFMLMTLCLFVHVRNTVVLYIRAGIWMGAILLGAWVVYMLDRHIRQRGDSE